MQSYHLIVLLSIAGLMKIAQCDEKCTPKVLSQSLAFCCGVRPESKKEPLLFSMLTSEYTSNVPTRCTTVTGLVLIPPRPSVCCPGPHGRTCCFVPTSKNHSSTPWYQNESGQLTEFVTYVLLAVFIVMLMSVLTLMAYCCQAMLERNQRRAYVELTNEPLTYSPARTLQMLEDSYKILVEKGKKKTNSCVSSI